MSKRLPYFQFEPAEYLAGDIMFCSYASQGMFNNICALYWQKDCKLSYSQTIKRLGNEDLIKELINENIIKVEVDAIIINFLNEQYNKATSKSNTNSENGKKGAQKRWRKDSESIATPLNNDSESIALIEDNIIEDEIRGNKENNNTIFYTDLLSSQSWLETCAMQNQPKFNLVQVKTKLLEFKKDLDLKFDIKVNKNEFASHFINWLNQQKNTKVKPFFDSPA